MHQEDITILNVYTTNNRGSRRKKQKLTELKGKTDKSTVTVGEFNTPLSVINTSRQKINKDIEDLNNMSNQCYRAEIYKTLHPMTTEYTFFFSSQPKTLSKIDHVLGNKTNQNKFNRIKITQTMFFDHNRIK